MMINKDAPIICAECSFVKINGQNLYCERMKRTVYNSKPGWCPFPTYPEDEKTRSEHKENR